MQSATIEPTTKRKKIQKNTPDKLLILTILCIVAFGIVMVYSASSYHAMANNQSPFKFAMRQGFIALGGIIAMLFIAYKLDYTRFAHMRLAWAFYGFAISLSILTLFIGEEINGARRWLSIGGITIQPSEIVKVAVIMTLATYIAKHRKELHLFRYVFKCALIVGIPAGVVLMENLSSALVILFIGALMLFVSTPKVWYYILGVIAVALVGGGVYMLAVTTEANEELPPPFNYVLKQYQLNRIRVWEDPWLDPVDKGYQPVQSLYAVGSGGIFGKGLGNGIQKRGFLPEPYNDIIFAVICEELGLVGAGCLLMAYTLLVLRGFAIAAKAYDLYGALIAVGISGMIGVQALINVGVNTNTLPTTGMQLPLVSYGGTAIAILLAALGLLINISRRAAIGKPQN